MGRRDRKQASNPAVLAGVAVVIAVAATGLIYAFLDAPAPVAPSATAYAPNPEAAPEANPNAEDGHLTGNMHTPGTLLAGRKNRLPELEAWAKAWEAAQASGAEPAVTSDEDAARLRDLVDKSDLSAMECFHISKLVSDRKDMPAAEAWINPGVTRAEAEIGQKAHDDKSVNSTLNAMGDVTPPLWARGERNGKLLERMATLTLRFDRTGPWSQRPEWSRIGRAESLYLQKKYQESLAEANTMVADMGKPDSQFRPEQKAGVHWIRALVLLELKQEVVAITDLEQVVLFPTFHHVSDAWPVLIRTLARSRETEKAQKAFDQYLELYHPDAATKMSLATEIVNAGT